MNITRSCIAVENLSFTYPERAVPALNNISLSAKPGEFIVLCGPSGCGKTTLLRQMKPALAPHGILSGEIYFEGIPLKDSGSRDAASKIGFVAQNPENQIVTDKVWHELAFGLESLGCDTAEIRLRVSETASFFGMENWFHKDVSELSGGQKQLLSLGSVMAMQPRLLILDEPTSQLDPIAAAEFLGAVGKINRELGVTVIMTEHRLEEVFTFADRVAVMEQGRLLCDGPPEEAGEALRISGHGMFRAMPAPMRVWAGIKSSLPCPVTVREGREWLREMNPEPRELPGSQEKLRTTPPAAELCECWFTYEKNLPDIIKNLSLKAYFGEITAVLGGNGTGKTTALSLIAGLNAPNRGKVKINGRELSKYSGAQLYNNLLGLLPQNPQSLFVAKTVGEDLMEILAEMKGTREEKRRQIREIAALCRLEGLLDFHPYDLSGGEQQRAALAKVLLLKPRILLLDEPTKGLDAEFKLVFAGILKKLTEAGAAVLMVSHDIEFCAEFADRCALFFDGGLVTENTPRSFFSGNSFYTSAANRMSREIFPRAVTVDEVITLLGGTPEEPDWTGQGGSYTLNEPAEDIAPPDEKVKKLSLPRAVTAVVSAVFTLLIIIFTAIFVPDFFQFVSGGNDAVQAAKSPSDVWRNVGIMGLIGLAVIVFTLAVSWKRGKSREFHASPAPAPRRLPKRGLASAAIILIAIPLTIFLGLFVFDDRKFYFISLLIIIETMIPFALVFESRRPQARELVIIAVLCAIAVAGRAAFFAFPQFKPVIAVVIISGVAFGGEAGFIVGAVSMFVSNMLFGQSNLTPWQMFSAGIIGFLAGILFQKGLLYRGRTALCIFGGIATFVIYGGLMNPASVLMRVSEPTFPLILAAYLQGIPFDLVHAWATVVFIFVIGEPMLEKLDRIKVKFGLIEGAQVL